MTSCSLRRAVFAICSISKGYGILKFMTGISILLSELDSSYSKEWDLIRKAYAELVSVEEYDKLLTVLNNYSHQIRKIEQCLPPIKVWDSLKRVCLDNAYWKDRVDEAIKKAIETDRILNNWDILSREGWSIPPNTHASQFLMIPNDEVEIERMMNGFFCQLDLDDLLSRVLWYLSQVIDILCPFVENALYEAKSCYENGFYTATCMLLFSVLDRILISIQRDSDRNQRGWRETGKKASINRFCELENNTPIKAYFYIHMVNNCAGVFFEKANDFQESPRVLNRNFLDHGMQKDLVKRVDCEKLFLYLYNLSFVVYSIS